MSAMGRKRKVSYGWKTDALPVLPHCPQNEERYGRKPRPGEGQEVVSSRAAKLATVIRKHENGCPKNRAREKQTYECIRS